MKYLSPLQEKVMWVVSALWLITLFVYIYGVDHWLLIGFNIACLLYIFITPGYYKRKYEKK